MCLTPERTEPLNEQRTVKFMASKLTLQKRLAADILKVGQSRIWINPDKEKQKDIQAAITRADVRKLVSKKVIKIRPGKIEMPDYGRGIGRSKRKRKKAGSRKGSKHARLPQKKKWISTVRPLRAMLKELRAAGKIDSAVYRRMYMLVKGGQFRSRSHMRLYMEQNGLLKKEK